MLHNLDDPVALPPLTSDERELVIRRGTTLRRRRRALQAGIASAVGVVAVVAAVALSTIPSLDAGPAPVGNLTPSPSISSTQPAPAPTIGPLVAVAGPEPAPTTGPFDAVVVRGTRLVALDGNGTERWSRDLADSGLTAADLQYAYVSPAGWLSMPGDDYSRSMSLLDLNDPKAALRTLDGRFDNLAWSPNGLLLATLWYPGGVRAVGQPSVVDPADGSRVRILPMEGVFTGGGPDPAWTADSTGLLVWNGGDNKAYIRNVATGQVTTEIPALWLREGRYETRGDRSLGVEELLLTVREPDGARSIWYESDLSQSDLSPQLIVNASFTADGKAAWLLLKDSNDSPKLTLARTDGARQTEVISTTQVNSTKWDYIAGVAPDDSMLVVLWITAPQTTGFYLLPTDGTAGIHLDGDFVGWMPASVVDQLD